MQTDELRAELAELAREVDPFPEDLAAIRRRVARRRVATASIVLVLIVGLIAGVIATTGSSGDRVRVAGHPKQTPIDALPRIDALVAFPAQAADTDITGVKGILDSTDVAKSYATLPHRAVDFLSLGKAIRNSVVLGVELDRAVVDRMQQLTAAVGSAATVKAFDQKGRSAYDDVEIFMQGKACSAQIDAVRRAVERDPDIELFRFLTKEDAFKEFKRLFKDQPSLVENTTASELPASFQLRVREGASPGAVASRYAPFAGVKGTLDRANPFAGDTSSIPENNDRSACPA